MSNIFISLTKRIKGDLYNDTHKCLYCGKCEKKCHHNAIKVNVNSKDWIWNTDKCVRCGHCIGGCPADALALQKTNK